MENNNSNNYRPGVDIPPLVGGDNNKTGSAQDQQVKYYSPAKTPYEEAKSKGTASMVLGIVSICCVLIPGIGWAAAIVTGIIGLIQGIKARKILHQKERGQATAGFICSIIGLGICALILLSFFMWAIIEAPSGGGLFDRHYYSF